MITQLHAFVHAISLNGNYSGYLFRQEAAKLAWQVGLMDDEIQLFGRLKSDAFRLYIPVDLHTILDMSRPQQRK